MDRCVEEAPIVAQPQFAPVPVSTDDIGDLYQSPDLICRSRAWRRRLNKDTSENHNTVGNGCANVSVSKCSHNS